MYNSKTGFQGEVPTKKSLVGVINNGRRESSGLKNLVPKIWDDPHEAKRILTVEGLVLARVRANL